MKKNIESQTVINNDIRAKKRLLKDFGFIITPELEQQLINAESTVQRENLVLGLIHGKFNKRDANDSAQREEAYRRNRFGHVSYKTQKEDSYQIPIL